MFYDLCAFLRGNLKNTDNLSKKGKTMLAQGRTYALLSMAAGTVQSPCNVDVRDLHARQNAEFVFINLLC